MSLIIRGHKNLIRQLPGPKSYCKCTSLCSPVTIDHVIPKSLIKNSRRLPVGCANDLHNLYPCCSKLNGDKGSLLFGKDFILDGVSSDHVGALARSCLYMYDKYDLPIDYKTVSLWRILNDMHPPKEFEVERNNIIYGVTGTENHYLVNHFLDKDEKHN